jgi:hypothetical protein
MNPQLAEIYNTLKRRDRTLSQRRFSKEYLERSEAYLFSNNYYGRDVSKGAAVALYNNLRSTADMWATLYEETRRERFAANHALFEELAAKAQQLVFAD